MGSTATTRSLVDVVVEAPRLRQPVARFLRLRNKALEERLGVCGARTKGFDSLVPRPYLLPGQRVV